MANKVNKNLKQWTPGEWYWLDRWMRRETQAQAAKRWRNSERWYGLIETDRHHDVVVRIIPSNNMLPLLKPPLGCLCALARRRHDLGLQKTARLLGTSHVTLLAWERSSDPRLISAWKRLGYSF